MFKVFIYPLPPSIYIYIRIFLAVCNRDTFTWGYVQYHIFTILIYWGEASPELLTENTALKCKNKMHFHLSDGTTIDWSPQFFHLFWQSCRSPWLQKIQQKNKKEIQSWVPSIIWCSEKEWSSKAGSKAAQLVPSTCWCNISCYSAECGSVAGQLPCYSESLAAYSGGQLLSLAGKVRIWSIWCWWCERDKKLKSS